MKDLGDLLQAARADAVRAVLVLLDLLEGHADRFSELVWLIDNIMRRMRTRWQTCLSVRFGDFIV